MELNNKKILITGASGLVGSELCRQLTANNEVWGLAGFRVPEIKNKLESQGVKIIQKDVIRESIFDLPKDFDVIFHQLVILYDADVDPIRTQNANAYFTGKLMEQCNESGLVILASTGGVYRASTEYASESDAPGPQGWYCTSKLGMEYLGTYMSRKYRIPGVILRYYWPYGIEQGRITRMIKSIHHGEEISISAAQEDRYQPIHIEDLARLTIESVNRADIDPPVYNIAGLEEITWSQMARMIGEELGMEPKFKTDEATRLSHLADLTRMKEEIGTPHISLKEGIHRVRVGLGF